MKKIQYLFATIILGFALTSCGDSFLTQYPEGGTLLQDQFEKLPDNLQGSIMGIYSKMYEYGGDHDEFGQRAIDMYGDIQSGDMAMASSSYGWFEVYERGYFYAYAPSYIWSYYYDMLNLINISAIAVEDNVPAIIDGMSGGELSEATKLWGYYYGQILALRGWAYAGLLRYFCDPMDMLSNPMDEELSIPVYTETEVKSGQMGAPRATVSEVYDRIYEDLSLAIELLDFYGQINSRGSKLEVDADVARIILAYAMLNHGDKSAKIFDKNTKNAYEVAIELASAVIAGGRYPIMKQADLTTTGFSDVSANNWMWGENVTVENSTALASFFGQVDIHTYSYAAAGDTKAIDSKLYDEIAATGWDARVNWFNDGTGDFPYCPEGKFYNPGTKDITDLDNVDRNWLCDNVFMRVEVAYLIAAEAAWANGDPTTAVLYLKQLCDERVIPGKEAAYATWLAGLSGDALKQALIYNWRVEMWGEGYGLQTLRRLSKTMTLGSNHLSRADAEISIASEKVAYQCEIPSTETRYNPYLNNRNLTHK